MVTPLAKPSGQKWLDDLGIEYDLTPLKSKLQEASEELVTFYPDNNHMQDWNRAEKVAEAVPYELQEVLAGKVAVVGEPDYVAGRMKELGSLGIDHIFLYTAETFSLPENELRAFEEVIGPALALSR